MALDEAAAGDIKGDVDEPELVEEPGGGGPCRMVEGGVVALYYDDAVVRVDGYVVLLGVLDSVVERGGVDRALIAHGAFLSKLRGGRGGYGAAEGSDESGEGHGVEGEGCAAAGVGLGWVGERREGCACEVEAVHGDGGGGPRSDGVYAGCYEIGKGCFALYDTFSSWRMKGAGEPGEGAEGGMGDTGAGNPCYSYHYHFILSYVTGREREGRKTYRDADSEAAPRA